MKTYRFIIGKKIVLRTLCLKDAQGPYVGWFNDETVCRYNQHHAFTYSKKKAEEYIRKTMRSRNELVLAITTKKSARHIGNIALQQIDLINRNAQLSIILGDKNYWAKGCGKEAVELLLRHGFSQLNLHRIYCATAENNIPMQKLALSVGMKREGKRREAAFKSGSYLNVIEYGLLIREYNRRIKNEQ